MKIKQTISLGVATVLALGVGSLAAAQEPSQDPTYTDPCADAPQATIASPSNNATVGRTFALVGTLRPTGGYPQYVTIKIDGQFYVDPKNRGFDPNQFNQDYYNPLTDAQGNFNFTIDLNGGDVLEQYVYNYAGGSSQVIRNGLTPGEHKLTVGDNYCFPEAATAFTLKDDAPRTTGAVPQYQLQPRPTSTPTPSAKPSIKPVTAAANEKTDLSTVWWVIAAFVIGGTMVALAEYTWRYYHKRNPGSKIPSKKK